MVLNRSPQCRWSLAGPINVPTVLFFPFYLVAYGVYVAHVSFGSLEETSVNAMLTPGYLFNTRALTRHWFYVV